jgi:hypothetical protein
MKKYKSVFKEASKSSMDQVDVSVENVNTTFEQLKETISELEKLSIRGYFSDDDYEIIGSLYR